MADRHACTFVSRDPTTDWCPRCNLPRTTVEFWVLTPDGMYKAGHGVFCGCYP
jgi:hypothetical protein